MMPGGLFTASAQDPQPFPLSPANLLSSGVFFSYTKPLLGIPKPLGCSSQDAQPLMDLRGWRPSVPQSPSPFVFGR